MLKSRYLTSPLPMGAMRELLEELLHREFYSDHELLNLYY